jgi:hypothetical protein
LIDGEPFPEPRLLTIDDRIEEAWLTLQENQELARLLLAYHECLRLAADGHTSYSLLAGVGIIESIGTGPQLFTCPTCHGKTGAIGRFRSALGKVMDEPGLGELAKAYDLRSNTAHNAVLHGAEPYASATVLPRFYASGKAFDHTLREVQSAAARLLARELRDAREARARGGVTSAVLN